MPITKSVLDQTFGSKRTLLSQSAPVIADISPSMILAQKVLTATTVKRMSTSMPNHATARQLTNARLQSGVSETRFQATPSASLCVSRECGATLRRSLVTLRIPTTQSTSCTEPSRTCTGKTARAAARSGMPTYNGLLHMVVRHKLPIGILHCTHQLTCRYMLSSISFKINHRCSTYNPLIRSAQLVATSPLNESGTRLV
jgi:hypothetical protein